VELHALVFDGDAGGVVIEEPTLEETKQYVAEQIKCMRPDIMREMNPGQYKVSVSDQLFHFLHKLWQVETPVLELR